MLSLSDIVQMFPASLSDKVVEFVLDPNMPQLYSNENDSESFGAIFGQLFGELRLGGKCRIITKLDGSTQILWIDNDQQIEDHDLAKLNVALKSIANGHAWIEGYSGNRIAATSLKRYDGRIYLEKIDDPLYHTRTVVEIPVPKG